MALNLEDDPEYQDILFNLQESGCTGEKELQALRTYCRTGPIDPPKAAPTRAPEPRPGRRPQARKLAP